MQAPGMPYPKASADTVPARMRIPKRLEKRARAIASKSPTVKSWTAVLALAAEAGIESAAHICGVSEATAKGGA